ncbi:3-beta hydroxysteroid dehydrogenase [Halobacteriales archaeon QS_3_64_16]|nr:MAG: 3-beta hydroxysteroid dehydrogenase [Halobacteriales archaeon QS_3_64_16]
MDPNKGLTVLLAGASGDTGRRVLYLLARSDLDVRALTSDPGKVRRLERAGADEAIVGDLFDRADAERAVEGVNMILTAVGSDPREVLLADELVDGVGNRNLVESAADAGVEAIVMESSLGVDGDRASPMAQFFGLTIGPVLDAKAEAERAIRESGLRYTILRPGILTTLSATDDVQVGSAGTGLWGTISRADVARLLVAAPFTPDAEDRTLEVVRNPLLRGRSERIDWQHL